MKTWGITNAGLVRSENQDAYAVFQTGAFHAAVVCDGMGGTNGGRVASAIAVSRFEEELRSALRDNMTAAQVRQAMLSAIACANDAIRQEAARNAEYQHMGTTLVCAVTRPDMAIIGNIGDSRAYHITAEGIFQISRDHSVVENMVAKGDLTPQEQPSQPKPDHPCAGAGYQCPGGRLRAAVAGGRVPAAVLRWAGEHRVGSGDAVRGASRRGRKRMS